MASKVTKILVPAVEAHYKDTLVSTCDRCGRESAKGKPIYDWACTICGRSLCQRCRVNDTLCMDCGALAYLYSRQIEGLERECKRKVAELRAAWKAAALAVEENGE